MKSLSISLNTSVRKLTDEEANFNNSSKLTRRSGWVWLAMFLATVYSVWAVYDYQFLNLPLPLTIEQAGEKGFSEEAAMKHAKGLTGVGPHPVNSDALDQAVKYVFSEAEKLKATANEEVDVQVELFHADPGANRLKGMFYGRTLTYADLSHVIIRILPKNVPEAAESAILVSAHIDTVFSAEGAGDDTSSVAVMLELARGVSHAAKGFKNAVIFFLNTGEEEGLLGAHGFITQHPWNSTLRMAVDLEAMGLGGKSAIFQAGPLPLAIENFAAVAKYPSGQISAQDIFSSGFIESGTDFQVYKEIAGLSGLDFAFTDQGAVYHTKNDKLELLTPGSYQHLGENMLPFLIHTATYSDLSKSKALNNDQKSDIDTAIYFDILGKYMVVYPLSFANTLNISVIILSLEILAVLLTMGGLTAAISLVLSFLSIILMWIFSIGFSAAVAFILVIIPSSPVPYIASPWLAVGLFAAPAFLGAIIGQHFGYLVLQKFLSIVYAKTKQFPTVNQADLAKFEAERWLYKAGFIPWLLILMAGTYYKVGSSYIAVLWLVPPAVAYGILETTLTSAQSPRPLKPETLVMGLAIPILVSAGVFIRFASLIIANNVRLDSKPGSYPEWLASLILAIFIAIVICLTMVYLLSYVHLSGTAKILISLLACILFILSLAAVYTGFIPPFTEDTARAVNVVHVVDSTGGIGEKPSSYVSLFSITPGKLNKEIDIIEEGFECGRNQVVDFVTFSVQYGCLTFDETEQGWNESDIPTLDAYDDYVSGDTRITEVAIHTKSSKRWALAINTEEIEDFTFKVNSTEIVPADEKTSRDGWHILQFSGGKNASSKFDLTLIWAKKASEQASYKKTPRQEEEQRPLLKIRTDLDDITPKVEKILSKLPAWCSLFGKSTTPRTLSFLSNLPVNFSISRRSYVAII